MTIPRSSKRSFRIGDYELCHYYGQDAHGTVCNSYYVDECLVHPDEFYRIIREELEDGKDYICRALGLVSVR